MDFFLLYMIHKIVMTTNNINMTPPNATEINCLSIFKCEHKKLLP